MNKYFILIFAAVFLTAIFAWRLLFIPKPETVTVLRDKYVYIPISKPAKPDTVIKYAKPDTVLRAKIVEGPVVVKVEMRDRWLGVQTIDTKGFIQEEKHKLPVFAYTVEVDTAGHAKIRRKILPRVLIGAGIAAVAVGSWIIGKKLVK